MRHFIYYVTQYVHEVAHCARLRLSPAYRQDYALYLSTLTDH